MLILPIQIDRFHLESGVSAFHRQADVAKQLS